MILVTGATTEVGQRVVRALAAAGEPVRALVPHPAWADQFEAAGATALIGDLSRAVDRASALEQVTDVIACHSLPDGPDAFVARDGDEPTLALVAAAQSRGVSSFILLSSTLCELTVDLPAAARLHRAEDALANGSMPYTVVRLAPLMTDLVGLPGIGNPGESGSFLIFGSGRNRITWLSADDAAELVLRCRQTDRARARTLLVGGPESLAWDQAPPVFQRAYQRNLMVWRLPAFLLQATRLIVSLFQPARATYLRYLELLFSLDLETDPGEVGALFGLELEDLESWLERTARGEEREVAASPLGAADDQPQRTVEFDQGPAAGTRHLDQPDDGEPPRVIERPHDAPTGDADDDPEDEPALRLERPTPPPAATPEPPGDDSSTPTERLDHRSPVEPEPEPVAELPVAPAEPDETAPEAVVDELADDLVVILPPDEDETDDDAAEAELTEPVSEPAAEAEPEPEPEPEPADHAAPVVPTDGPVATPPAGEAEAEADGAADEPLVAPADVTADEESPWGSQAEFGPGTVESPPASGKRPPVARPSRVDDPVIDADRG